MKLPCLIPPAAELAPIDIEKLASITPDLILLDVQLPN